MNTENHCISILLTIYVIRLLSTLNTFNIINIITIIFIFLLQLVLCIIIWKIISIIFDINTSSNTIIGFNEIMVLYMILPFNINTTYSKNTMKVLLLSILSSWSFILALLSSLVYFLDWNEIWMTWPIPTLTLIVIGTFIDYILIISNIT